MRKTKELKKKLDEFKLLVSVNGEIPEEFCEKISEMESAVARASEKEGKISADCMKCDHYIGINKYPTDLCPVCGAIVPACNACKEEACGGCVDGCNFEEWNTLVDYEIIWHDRGGKKHDEVINANSENEALIELTDREEMDWHDMNGTIRRVR